MQPFTRIVAPVVGGTVLLVDIGIIVLPDPAFLVIPAGLAILAIEFAWAEHWLRSTPAALSRPSVDTAPGRQSAVESIRRSASFLLWPTQLALLPKEKSP